MVDREWPFGPDIACDGDAPERGDYRRMELVERLCAAVGRLNPAIPAVAREDAIQLIIDLDTPVLLWRLSYTIPTQHSKGKKGHSEEWPNRLTWWWVCSDLNRGPKDYEFVLNAACLGKTR